MSDRNSEAEGAEGATSEEACLGQMKELKMESEIADDDQTASSSVDVVPYENELQMPDIIRLITKDLSEPYSIYTYRYFIHNWPELCYLAKTQPTKDDDTGEYIGAVICKLAMHPAKGTRRGYIAMLAVDERWRRLKIGTRLVSRAIATMVEMGCDENLLAMIDPMDTGSSDGQHRLIIGDRQHFSPSAFVKRITPLLEKGDIELAYQFFQDYLSFFVPTIFKPNLNPTDLTYDEEVSTMFLISPFMHVLCGAPALSFDQYAEKLNIARTRPGQICGRLFRNGEPTYSCKDCATDPTCVMCYECFSRSEHKSHKYKMHPSGGSGYCDCGDPEAWKRDAYCTRHKPMDAADSAAGQEGSPVQLPVRDEMRMSAFVACILRYTVELLSWDYCDILPAGLTHQVMNLPYQTMLFNDESHTYDQVIKALTKAIDCDEERAMLLATVVDREGRSSVRSGAKEDCERAKAIIQQRTARESRAPLIVETMDSNLVAHQQFAMKLVHWLTNATTILPPLVTVVAKTIMHGKFVASDGSDPLCDDTYVTKLMKRDFKMWKSARSSAHELLMGTVLMDTEKKKEFAKLFVRMYSELMQKHIDDDHEHSLSITALTVQIFTVPTIAKLLIADENALFHVIHTFFGKASRHITSNGRFSFQRAPHAAVLRRSLYALCDARYLLTVPPADGEWTEQLRRNFCIGVKALLDILLCMQGMDEVVRQVNQHQEWEPEWETAFNIQIRLTPIVSQIQRWTKTDRECLTIVFNETMAKLYHYPDVAFLTSVAQCTGHQTECIVYDVSKRPVSIHLPLTRLLAALYLNFSAFGLKLTSPDVNSADSTLSVERLIELPMRTLVMIAQSSAGMWRRNGYSLINQIHNYLSPVCRSEMFDRDVLMLQIGAANMEPNEFIVRLLEKFGLLGWASATSLEGPNGEEESVKQTVTIAEELLHLVLMITGERWVPGVGEVTKEEAVRREVIHMLCKGPAAYSKLDKHLPEDHLEKTGLEQVIRTVADFREPTGTSAGVFELKAACRGDYNSFFNHYSKIDFSKAEELQRKERRDDPLDIRACPPPLPPAFTDPFASIVNIFTCDVMLQILTNVLKRAKSYGRLHTDGQLHRALHVIGLALREEIRQHDHNWKRDQGRKAAGISGEADRVFARFVFTQPAVEFAKAKGESTVLELLEGLLGQAQTQYYQDLLRWMIMKFREASSLHEQPENESGTTVEISIMEGMDGSRCREMNDDGEQERKRRRREMAMKQRQRAMEHMQRLQKDFMKSNKALFEHAGNRGNAEDDEETETEMGQLASAESFPVALGPSKSELVELGMRKAACVLCQEGQDVTFGGRAIVYAAFVQTSALFSKSRGRIIDNPERHDPLYAAADMHAGVLTSTCGHTMHWDCWQQFYDSVVSKEQRRPLRWRFSSFFDVDNGEYLCPLCKRLSNTVLPVLPPLRRLNFDSPQVSDVPYKDWLAGLETAVSATTRTGLCNGRAASSSSAGGQSVAPGPVTVSSGIGASWMLRHSRSRSSTSSSSSSSIVEAMDVQTAGSEHNQDGSTFVGVSVLADLLPSYNSIIELLTQNMPSSVVEQLSRVWRHLSSFNEDMPMSASYFEMLRTFSQAVYSHGLKVAPFHDSPRAPVMSWLTTAFTVRCIDACLAFDEKPLFGAFSARQRDCLYASVRYGAVCNLVSKPAVVRRHLVRLLQPFLGAGGNGTPTVVELDSFGTLVELTYAIGWLHAEEEDAWTIPTGGVGEFHVFRLVLSAYVLQVALTVGYEGHETAVGPAERARSDREGSPEDQDAVSSFFTAIRNALFGDDSAQFTVPSQSIIVNRLKIGLVRGFLRPAALFYHALTHVPPPEALKDPSIDEFGPLCRFMGMPVTLADLLTKFVDIDSMQKWCAHPRVKELVIKKQLVRQPVNVNLLMTLPVEFSELINKAALFNCPSLNSDESRSPTMCLACGALLCSQSYCCQKTLGDQQVGACTYHANSCTAGTGVFLKVRDCQVVLQFQQHRGCILPAPYVDEYGETDPGFRRGYPLHLNRDLYRRLQLCWLGQNVPEQIVNKMELAGTQWMAQEWQHL